MILGWQLFAPRDRRSAPAPLPVIALTLRELKKDHGALELLVLLFQGPARLTEHGHELQLIPDCLHDPRSRIERAAHAAWHDELDVALRRPTLRPYRRRCQQASHRSMRQRNTHRLICISWNVLLLAWADKNIAADARRVYAITLPVSWSMRTRGRFSRSVPVTRR